MAKRCCELRSQSSVCLADLFGRTLHAHVAFFDPEGLFAEALYLIDAVRDEQKRRAVLFKVHGVTIHAYVLEQQVAYRQCFVNEEDEVEGLGSVTVAIAKAMRATMPLE